MRARYNVWTMEASGIDVCNAMNEYCGDRDGLVWLESVAMSYKYPVNGSQGKSSPGYTCPVYYLFRSPWI